MLLEKTNNVQAALKAISRFVIFFMLVAFVVTCNFFLFFNSVQMSEEEIREAAPITFLNVILLTIIFCVIDYLRRIWMVNRPVKRIQEGMNQIMEGDFSVRLPYIKGAFL